MQGASRNRGLLLRLRLRLLLRLQHCRHSRVLRGLGHAPVCEDGQLRGVGPEEGLEALVVRTHQLRIVRFGATELRCDAVQGYFFAEPLTAEECLPLLKKRPA